MSPKHHERQCQRQPSRWSHLGLLALAAAASSRRVDQLPSLSITKAPAKVPPALLARRAGGPYAATLINEQTAYFTKVRIGTPQQEVTLHVDTGSSDLWVLWTQTDLCLDEQLQAEWGMCLDTFEPELSRTYKTVDRGGFSIQYVDGTGAAGDYFSDNVALGNGIQIQGLQMGIAIESTCNWGILGIGYSTSVAADYIYPNIIELMQNQSYIATKAYSLYLNDYSAATGTILFGGIDTTKFYGDLKVVPVLGRRVDDGFIYDHFVVSLTSVTSHADGQETVRLTSSDANIPVVLDSGTSFAYFPSTITKPLYDSLGAYDDTTSEFGSGEVYVDCKYRSQSDRYLSFQFNGADGPVISVPASEYILDDLKPYIRAGLWPLPANLPFSDVCRMAIRTQNQSPPYIVGDSFLRSAYVVYDLEYNRVGLAQANTNANGSNIVEITGPIQSVKGVPMPDALPWMTNGASHEVTLTAGAVACVAGLVMGFLSLA
ncbi:uncharacterized protein CTHT_0050140 [Thermochaetoides thermophila DSM 1495]|uniref:Peptidase A1 domain-containing protein n=1 Tax=Chaetomium thermophilum (strain DSM 1495 / CBS 144.50 / IMI 039719) TaxID=759272 RepID=G0SBG0_CHATD|nr:hypothetical protein CTHT_0050140 [Thermochaetoides thermophila DSM 1495]EGS19540.1 hypothetical protein CTHT_0050140 [Thermochaetoides thermophila DSM 1495]